MNPLERERHGQGAPQLLEGVRGTLDILRDRIDGLPSALRQVLADELWSAVPTWVDESVYQASFGSGTLYVAPQFTTLEKIENVVAVVPAGATGVIQLGSTYIPVGAGLSSFSVVKLLSATDTRSISVSGAAGAVLLWLTGQQAPTFGVVGP